MGASRMASHQILPHLGLISKIRSERILRTTAQCFFKKVKGGIPSHLCLVACSFIYECCSQTQYRTFAKFGQGSSDITPQSTEKVSRTQTTSSFLDTVTRAQNRIHMNAHSNSRDDEIHRKHNDLPNPTVSINT
jgi:hypothetical protein